MSDDIDVEYLIMLVSQNPCIWDRSAEGYHCRPVTDEAWRNICRFLNETFQELSEQEQDIFEKAVLNKWRNIRDQWLKAAKKVEKDRRYGKGNHRVKPYVYSNQLSFLNKTAELKVEPDIPGQSSPPEDTRKAGHSAPGPSRRKSKALRVTAEQDEEEVRKMAKLDLDKLSLVAAKEEDPKVMFFKGVLPHMSDFTDDETLQFQSGVLSLIQQIRKQRFMLEDSTQGQSSVV